MLTFARSSAVLAVLVLTIWTEPTAAQTGTETMEEIAFVSDRAGSSEIFLITSEGGQAIPLTTHPAQDGAPAWSPDGMQLAFASTRSGNWDLYVLDMATRAVRQLTFAPAADFDPAWSDEGRIAYESFDGTRRKIRIVPATGGASKRITALRGVELDPAFLDRQILFTREHAAGAELWSTTVGSTPRRITAEGSGDSHVAVTPNERRLAFERPNEGTADDLFQRRARRRTRPEEITDTPADEGEPSWAPDSRRLAFMTTRDGDHEIYFRNSETGETFNVSRHPAEDTTPAWRPPAPPVVPPPAAFAVLALDIVCPFGPTNGSNRIIGTSLGEPLCGKGGNDVLLGRGGNDRMCGGAGRDKVKGQRGDDSLLSGGDCGLGRDRLRGGRNNDRIFGDGDGTRDCLWGGPGNDQAWLDRKDNTGCGNTKSIEAV